jgi:preprotein translocase subunit SecE
MADAVTRTDERGFVSRVVGFYHDVVAEMKKVTWPDFPQVRQATIAIIIFVLVIGLVIWLLDLALQGVLVKLIPSLFSR